MPLLPRNELFAALLLTSLATAQHEGVTPATQAPPGAVDYARAVRPILAHYCYDCHGPDEQKRKADLRLDRREDAFAVRDGVAAFVAGDPAASMALRHVLAEDPEERMPPPKTGRSLRPAEIETLRTWLAAGAPWSEHWAFVPPVRPTPPTVREATWPKNDVDRFVLARLEQEGLRPSAEAERTAWLRRVTFDLIGVPPTPAELDAFVADQGADAFEKVVDRLLADPRYGERMASDWLDLARYADSSGYQRDTPRQAWKWRDWVIEALQREPAVRPVHRRTARRRPAAEPDAEPAHRHGLQPQPSGQHRGRRRARRVPQRLRDRPRAHDGDHVPRLVGRLRAVPRPQVRPDQRSASSIASTTSSTT
jgi:hypothetical protein